MSLKIVHTPDDGFSVSFDFEDEAWFNATEAAKYFGKRVDIWLKTKKTKEYISVLCAISKTTKNDYVKTKRGPNAGIWFHPDLAIVFARWLDVRFSLWCDHQDVVQ